MDIKEKLIADMAQSIGIFISRLDLNPSFLPQEMAEYVIRDLRNAKWNFTSGDFISGNFTSNGENGNDTGE